MPLRAPPTGVAAGSGSTWAAEPAAGLVIRINPRRRAVAATIPVGTHPSRIIAADGQIWVLDPADRTLSRIDPQTNTVAQTIALGGQPSDVAASAGSLWVANRDGTVLRIDPGTGRTLKRGQDRREPQRPGGHAWRGVGGNRPVRHHSADRCPDRRSHRHDSRRRRPCRDLGGCCRAVGA